ncbi:MAG: TonB-dependent receptor, partial [Acinetobacter sp.]
MQYKAPLFVLSLLSLSVQSVMAEEQVSATQDLPTIQLHAKTASDRVIADHRLVEGATTIGNALNGQPGVYSAQYTGGVSRPVIRGQDGVRVKILQNGADLLDVSSVSPDHAVTVDPNSAQQIQILKGPETLLYGAGSPGGLVNVIDDKIPTEMPEGGYTGRAGIRYNTGSDERLYSGQTTVGLGDHVAVRVGGSKRDANNYILPKDLQTESRREANTFADSENYNAGLSWISDRGFIGVSYAQRHDQYGIPAENALYESCVPNTSLTALNCSGNESEESEDESGSSWINLKEKRYDVKAELKDPFAGFSKLAAQFSYSDYQHEEMHGSEVETTFKSQGSDTRITLNNNPWAGWEGQFGAQYTNQKVNIIGDEAVMDPTRTQRYSVFGVQKKQLTDHVDFAASARVDHQKIDIDSNLKNYDGTAYSVAGTTSWEFIPQYKLSLTASHQERMPYAQELYSNGIHMATNTY